MIQPGNLHNLHLDQQTNFSHSGNFPIFSRNWAKQQLKPKLCDSRDFVPLMKLWSCEWNGLYFFWMSTRWQWPGQNRIWLWDILTYFDLLWNFDTYLIFEIGYDSSSFIIHGFWIDLLCRFQRTRPSWNALSQLSERGVYDPSEQLLAPPPHQRHNNGGVAIPKWS